MEGPEVDTVRLRTGAGGVRASVAGLEETCAAVLAAVEAARGGAGPRTAQALDAWVRDLATRRGELVAAVTTASATLASVADEHEALDAAGSRRLSGPRPASGPGPITDALG